MLKTTVKFIFRNLRKSKIFTVFSIFSLCLGFLSCLLAYLYISDELSYDTFFDHSNRIVRMGYSSNTQSGALQEYASLPHYFLPSQMRSIPEIEKFTRLAPLPNHFLSASHGNKVEERHSFATDSSFFDVFNFHLIDGSAKNPLSQPNSVVLTQQTAQKYFGDGNAVGKILEIHFGQKNIPLTVTAIIQNIPTNTHFNFDLLVDSRSFEELFDKKITDAYTAYEYLLLSKDFDLHKLLNDLNSIKPEIKDAPNFEFRYNLIPITDIHLYSSARAEIKPTSDVRYIYFFFLIASIILIISSINYISLFLSHATDRFKEIGIRKSLGAYNSQLIRQLLLESVFISLLSLGLAFALAYWVLPLFNSLTGKSFISSNLFSFSLIGNSGLLAVFIGLLTGIYPALTLTKGKTSIALSNFTGSEKSNSSFKQAIVVLQFTASISLIICTLVVYNQLNYLENKDLGFTKNRIITASNSLNENLNIFKDLLSDDPQIQGVTASSYIPGTGETSGTSPVNVIENGRKVTSYWVATDYNFFDTFGIKIVEGRKFSKNHATDSTDAFMINQTASVAFGLPNPIGKRINAFNRTGTIVGVTDNFNYLSLHQQVPPMIFFIDKNYYFSLSIKLAEKFSTNLSLQKIENAWNTLEPNIPFDYSFLDNQYENLYKSERHFGKSIFTFSIIAILISCLGLFSLVAYKVERKTKEIGIRKVLGATTSDIIQLLSSKFFKLIFLSYIIAIPISYWALSKWLNNFAFRTNIGFTPFLITLFITIIATILALSFWITKAVRKNPVDSISTS